MNNIHTSHFLMESLRLCRVHAVPLLVGVIFFASISTWFSLWREADIHDVTQTILASMKESNAPMAEVLDSLEYGTTQDTLNLLVAAQGNGMAPLDALSVLSSLMPVVQMMLWSMLVSLILACMSSLYFLCSASQVSPSVRRSISLFFLSIPSMIVISVWSSVRSFTWVPFIGPLLGILLLPRFLFAPVIRLQEHKSAFASVQESFVRTKHSTWYILSAFSISSFVAFFIAGIVIVLLAFSLDSLIGRYSVFIRSVIWNLALAYTVASVVVLDTNLSSSEEYSL